MMNVEFGLERIRLDGTDLAIHTSFRLDVTRVDGLHIRASVQMAEGRLVCRALDLSTEHGEIDRKLLSGLGLATMIRQAADSGASRIVSKATWDEGLSDYSRFDAAVIKSDVKRRRINRVPLRRPWRLSDEFLKQVARTYLAALDNHESTAIAVGKLWEPWAGIKGIAPPSTVGRWIAAARARGFLKQTTKGRKGG